MKISLDLPILYLVKKCGGKLAVLDIYGRKLYIAESSGRSFRCCEVRTMKGELTNILNYDKAVESGRSSKDYKIFRYPIDNERICWNVGVHA